MVKCIYGTLAILHGLEKGKNGQQIPDPFFWNFY
jgi:hypothetical protein